MWGMKMATDEDKPAEPKQPGPVFGCAMASKSYTHCGRTPEGQEFVFYNGSYAAAHYDSRKRKIPFGQLSVCHACADQIAELKTRDENVHAKI
jgi:hypothetical protein